MAAEYLEEKFGKRIYSCFEWMKGLAPNKLEYGDVVVGERHIECVVPFSNGGLADVHFRWASEEELELGMEMDEDSVGFFNEYAAGKPVVSFSLQDSENMDEVYLLAKLEGGYVMQIPVGYNAELGMVYGTLEGLLTKEEANQFLNE